MSEQAVNTIETPEKKGAFRRIVETVLRVFGLDDFNTYAQVMHNFIFVGALVLVGVIEILRRNKKSSKN